MVAFGKTLHDFKDVIFKFYTQRLQYSIPDLFAETVKTIKAKYIFYTSTSMSLLKCCNGNNSDIIATVREW